MEHHVPVKLRERHSAAKYSPTSAALSNRFRPYNSVSPTHFDRDTRWPGALRAALGPDYEIIEEGLGGRATVWHDPIEGYKNGRAYLIPCLAWHAPLDLVVIMLGTNDLKQRFSLSALDIAEGAGALVGEVQRSGAGLQGQSPLVLLLAPPLTITLTVYARMFEGVGEKSLKLGGHFEASKHHRLGKAVAAHAHALLDG